MPPEPGGRAVVGHGRGPARDVASRASRTPTSTSPGATRWSTPRRCWASLWTARAIAYRQAKGFAHESVHLAVVVQEMFPSEVSGVLFTANPMTSNPRRARASNASWGLGEAIVSGQVNPDQLIVAKGTLARSSTGRSTTSGDDRP